MKIGRIYRKVDGRFPFDAPFGIYTGIAPSKFLQFVWNGLDMMVNGGDYVEMDFTVQEMGGVIGRCNHCNNDVVERQDNHTIICIRCGYLNLNEYTPKTKEE